MLRSRTLLALLPLTAACHNYGPYPQERANAYGIAETKVDEAVDGSPAYGVPILIPGGHTRVVPFSREQKKNWYSDGDHFREGGLAASGYSRNPADRQETVTAYLRWHNAVFHDLLTGEQWALLAQRGVVSRSWMKLRQRPGGDVNCHALAFAVTVEDSNGDGVLDDRDAARVVMTDPDGRNPRFVTPVGTQISNVIYDIEMPFAVLMVRRDRNGDGKFTEDEAPEPFLLALDDGTVAMPLVQESTREAIDSVLGEVPASSEEE